MLVIVIHIFMHLCCVCVCMCVDDIDDDIDPDPMDDPEAIDRSGKLLTVELSTHVTLFIFLFCLNTCSSNSQSLEETYGQKTTDGPAQN